MKRLLCIVISVISIFAAAFVGCKQEPPTNSNPAVPNIPENPNQGGGENNSPPSIPESSNPVIPSIPENSYPGKEQSVPYEPNFAQMQAFTFLPDEKSDLNVERFKADFIKSSYYREESDYEAFYNYMPEEISTKYNIDAFEVVCGDSEFYVWFDGFITRVDSIGARPDSNKGFIHFALTDINADGYFELLSSYNQNRVNDNKRVTSFSYFSVLDSKSKKAVESSTVYDGFVYFKLTNNSVSAYIAEEKDINVANTFYTDFIKNTSKYEFKWQSLSLQSQNYNVTVTVDEAYVHFPVHFKYANLYYKVTTQMTWLGNTFSYVNSNTYCAGASAEFKNDKNDIPIEPWAAGEAITTFIIIKGQVLTRSYNFYDDYKNRNKDGVYDLFIAYRGEEIFVKDFLKVTKPDTLTESAIEELSDEELIALHNNAEKFPKGFVFEELNGYERVVPSASSAEDAIAQTREKFTNDSYVTTKCELKIETFYFYGIYVRWDARPETVHNDWYEEYVVCFKKSLCEINNISIKGGVEGKFKLKEKSTIKQVFDYCHYSRFYNIGGYKVLLSEVGESDEGIVYTIYFIGTVGGDFGVKDKVTLYKQQTVVSKTDGAFVSAEAEEIKTVWVDGALTNFGM